MIQRLLSFSGLIMFALMAFPSCDKRETEDLDLDYGYDYAPLSIGQTRLYQMDSVVFDPDAKAPGGIRKDTSRTFVLERLADTLRDNTGELVYRLERYERKSASQPWEIKAVYTEQTGKGMFLRTEDNLRFIKLVFPIRQGKAWNGNVYFDPRRVITVPGSGETLEMYKGWACEYTAVNEPWTLDGRTFPKTIAISLANLNTAIELRQVTERYALGIGLVYRELFILDTQCIAQCQNQSWEQKAQKGFIIRQKLLPQ